MRTGIGRSLAAFGMSLAVVATGLVASGTPAHAACQTVHIWSTDDYKYVAAEKDYPGSYSGVLRARTSGSQLGTWEKFDMCFISGYTFTLRAWANGLYVTREANYTGRFSNVLRARTPGNQLGTWEQFRLGEPGGDVNGILGSNGKFVSEEQDYNDAYDNMLRARADVRGPWESWQYQVA